MVNINTDYLRSRFDALADEVSVLLVTRFQEIHKLATDLAAMKAERDRALFRITQLELQATRRKRRRKGK
jgi:hypothetical protein